LLCASLTRAKSRFDDRASLLAAITDQPESVHLSSVGIELNMRFGDETELVLRGTLLVVKARERRADIPEKPE